MPRFRPMGLGDIFDEAFDLYRKHLLYLLLVCAIVLIPTHLLAPLLVWALPDIPSLSHLAFANFGEVIPAWLLRQFGAITSAPAIFSPMFLLASGIGAMATAGAASLCYLDQPHTLWSAYRIPLSRLFSLTVALIIYLLLMLLGLLVCYVGIAVPLVLLIFFAQTFAVEGQNYGNALRRSQQLVSGDGMRVFGCLVLLWLVAQVVHWGVSLPLMYAFDVALNVTPGSDLFTSGVGAATALDHQRRIIASICDSFSGLLITPFSVCVLTVLYYDLRIRKEAFDITLLARALHYPPLDALRNYLPSVTPLLPVNVSAREGKRR